MLTSDERAERIESYGRGPITLNEFIHTLPREMWQFRPAPDRWTIHEIICHLADAEVNGYVRLRKLLAEPGDTVGLYDQDAWTTHLDYHQHSVVNAVELFRILRQSNMSWLRSLDDDAWSTTIQHPERGKMSLDDWLVAYDDHLEGHIKQMTGNLEAWRAQASQS